jgi:hypothetical protein
MTTVLFRRIVTTLEKTSVYIFQLIYLVKERLIVKIRNKNSLRNQQIKARKSFSF